MFRFKKDKPPSGVPGPSRWPLRWLLTLLLCYGCVHPSLLLAKSDELQEQSLVNQEIRYHMPTAGEVFLLWGINGWAIVPEASRPAGTVVQDGVMHTPMDHAGDVFVTTVRVPAGATIDFGFVITKKRSGADIRVWDGNGGQDYHTLASRDGVDDIYTPLTLANTKENPTDFNLGGILLIALLIILVLTLVVMRQLQINTRRSASKPAMIILCTGASLWFFLLFIRAHVMGFAWISLQYSFMLPVHTLAAGYYDLLYVSILTLFFLTLTRLLRNYPKAQRGLCLTFMGSALLSLWIAFLNSKIVPILGHPFNYQWLYYSDHLQGVVPHNTILAHVSWESLSNILALSIAMVVLFLLLMLIQRSVLHYTSKRFLLISFLLPFLVYMPVAKWHITTNDWDYVRLANPVTSFLQSLMDSRTYPLLFTMKVPQGIEAFPHPKERPLAQPVIRHHNNSTEVRNVVIFVMESVPAEYIEAYGGKYPVTPNLNKYFQNSLVFKNFYAHAPSTVKSLFSILTAAYPWVSYHSFTAEYPGIKIPTLSGVLQTHGYHTGFFSSADLRYQKTDEFLSHHNFDTVEYYDDLGCAKQTLKGKDWTFDGYNDECSFNAFSDWVSNNGENPFFAMLWTNETHYPYVVVADEDQYVEKSEQRPWLTDNLNRYLNALHHSDVILGKLLDTLKNRDLFESTLVVVVGDHGEAFGRHERFGHASHLYEENVHVPLVFINPGLLGGEEIPTVGGHVDIAPTVMDILNLPAPVGWQGQSLFNNERHGRVYFFFSMVGHFDGLPRGKYQVYL